MRLRFPGCVRGSGCRKGISMRRTSARSIGICSGMFTSGRENTERCGLQRAGRCSATRRTFLRRWTQFLARIEGGAGFRDVTADEFVTQSAGFLAEVNAIHPFREGNGRTQAAFAGLIGAAFGQPLQLRRVSQRTFPPAMVASFAGDLGPLISELGLLRG